MEKKTYPIGEDYYILYEEVGQGVSASVHRALCKPLNEIVAIKILDFERENCDLVYICVCIYFFYLNSFGLSRYMYIILYSIA